MVGILGVMVLGESLSRSAPVGAVVVLAGATLTQVRRTSGGVVRGDRLRRMRGGWSRSSPRL
ncbi:hypothetical protein [Streptomyces sp. NPDC005374]|uniref:hypothetical protein n=1 Tax=Streptomyces sp. NPDC005374 TaxID=3364713 RepID=UPI0036A9604F